MTRCVACMNQHMIRTCLLFLALLTVPVALPAQTADFYVLPVAGHTDGLNGTKWTTDIVLHNFLTTPLEAELTLIRTGERAFGNTIPVPIGPDRAPTVTVRPGGSALLADVLGELAAGGALLGAIMIEGNQPFAVTSRSFGTAPGGGTFGQTVTAAARFLENTNGVTDHTRAVVHIPGIANNARYRTNLGFVAGTSASAQEPLVLEVTLRNGSGAPSGDWRRFAIPRGVFVHLQFSSRVMSRETFDVGAATFRILSGHGAIVPYASVIDNVTADAVFITAQFPDSAPAAPQTGSSVFREWKRAVTGEPARQQDMWRVVPSVDLHLRWAPGTAGGCVSAWTRESSPLRPCAS